MNRETLIAAGIDYDQGVERFAGRAALYEKYLKKLFDDDIMGTFTQQLRAGDMNAAFRAAHDLKGLTGNLAINDLFRAISALVEALRRGDSQENIKRIYEYALSLYETAETAVRA